MTIQAAVMEVVAETLRLDADEFSADTRFVDLGRTSFQEVELLTGIEDRFQIELDFEEFTALATVGELVAAVAAASGIGADGPAGADVAPATPGRA